MNDQSRTIGGDRTGGSRRKAGVNPPVACFSRDFSPKSEPPEPFTIESLGRHAVERDRLAEQAEMMASSELFEKSEDNQVQRTA